MNRKINGPLSAWTAFAGIFVLFGTAPLVSADEHCGELGDCRVLIEINASDGDIGIHALFDGDGWEMAQMDGPMGATILDIQLADDAEAPLAMQKLTELFFESTEPVCEEGLVEEPGDPFQTLATFLGRFAEGTYDFNLDGDTGSAPLTHVIPAAPADVHFNGNHITWEYGDDLGECTTWPAGFEPADEEDIAGYEVVLEPDDDDLSHFKFTVLVPASVNKVKVPRQYLDSLPTGTPVKVEVGAIEAREDGHPLGNQTFTEEDGFCNNANQNSCPEEEE